MSYYYMYVYMDLCGCLHGAMWMSAWHCIYVYMALCRCLYGAVYMAILRYVDVVVALCGCLHGVVWISTWRRVDVYMAPCATLEWSHCMTVQNHSCNYGEINAYVLCHLCGRIHSDCSQQGSIVARQSCSTFGQQCSVCK